MLNVVRLQIKLLVNVYIFCIPCFSFAKARIQNHPRRNRQVVQRKRWSAVLPDGTNTYIKVTFWTLTAVCSAAAIAYFRTQSWTLGWW